VPRAYDIFRVYEGMEGEKNKNKVMTKKENLIQNKMQDFKNTFLFQKPKFYCKPTYEVGSV
jgi:hypothetical protein